MKLSIQVLALSSLLFAGACSQKSGEHEHDTHDTHTHSGPNQALYDEVMDVHDEVMPKMNDLHKAKTSLKTRLESPELSENEKTEINEKIARIDSASEGMMVWMRQFNPLPESADPDSARQYLENELKKVKQIKEDILSALQPEMQH